jgi:LAO/AO transport system kinase
MNFKLLLNRLRGGDRLALSKAISMAESQLPQDRQRLKYLLETLPPTPSLRVGVTGAPGVGKSALLQVLAQHIISDMTGAQHVMRTDEHFSKVKDSKDGGDFKEQSSSDNMINKLAILTIDPSSSVSGGSILGDKVRMSTISNDENIFIRQSATAGHLGGVSRCTYNAIRVCESKLVFLLV